MLAAMGVEANWSAGALADDARPDDDRGRRRPRRRDPRRGDLDAARPRARRRRTEPVGDEGDGGDERRRRLVGRRRPARRRGPRRRRRDDAPVGRRERHGLLQRVRCRRRPPRRRRPRHRAPRVQLQRRLRRPRRRRRTWRRIAPGSTPNPCIECNRKVKFARLSERAAQLGFDAVATGHHARIGRRGEPLHARARRRPGQGPELRRAHARPGRSRPHDVPDRVADQGRGPPAGRPARAAHGDEAGQPGRLLHHHARAAASSSSAGGSRSRRLASSTPADRPSAPSRRSSS